jgi:hypothetical protein
MCTNHPLPNTRSRTTKVAKVFSLKKCLNPHFMLNGEIRRAPMPLPDGSTQMAWEDAEVKVS